MAIENLKIDSLHPIIEYVSIDRQNDSDHDRVTFVVKDNPYTVIKWCRKNFGERGDGWDFTGSGKKANITIWSSRLITMYRLWQE